MDDLITDYQIKALIEATAPVFTGEARYRFKALRMAILMDQSQMAKLLGVGVATVTNLENGSRMTRNPILMTTFIKVFGIKGAVHILTGKYAASFDFTNVHEKYWKFKHSAAGNRVPYREREEMRYRDFTKTELMHEVEYLRKILKSREFKTETNEGEA